MDRVTPKPKRIRSLDRRLAVIALALRFKSSDQETLHTFLEEVLAEKGESLAHRVLTAVNTRGRWMRFVNEVAAEVQS